MRAGTEIWLSNPGNQTPNALATLAAGTDLGQQAIIAKFKLAPGFFYQFSHSIRQMLFSERANGFWAKMELHQELILSILNKMLEKGVQEVVFTSFINEAGTFSKEVLETWNSFLHDRTTDNFNCPGSIIEDYYAGLNSQAIAAVSYSLSDPFLRLSLDPSSKNISSGTIKDSSLPWEDVSTETGWEPPLPEKETVHMIEDQMGIGAHSSGDYITRLHNRLIGIRAESDVANLADIKNRLLTVLTRLIPSNKVQELGSSINDTAVTIEVIKKFIDNTINYLPANRRLPSDLYTLLDNALNEAEGEVASEEVRGNGGMWLDGDSSDEDITGAHTTIIGHHGFTLPLDADNVSAAAPAAFDSHWAVQKAMAISNLTGVMQMGLQDAEAMVARFSAQTVIQAINNDDCIKLHEMYAAVLQGSQETAATALPMQGSASPDRSIW